MVDVSLKCSCGKVNGLAKNVSGNTGSRLVCCCDDCQAFAHFLEREDDILDDYGGTDIFQMTPAQIEITSGKEYLRCLRLTPKGIIRWYTDCCKTPIGNTVSAGLPFIGLIHNFMFDNGVRDKNLGPILGYLQCRFAKKEPPVKEKYSGFPFRILIRAFSRILLAKIRGQHKPNAFFDDEGKPISEPNVIDRVNQ